METVFSNIRQSIKGHLLNSKQTIKIAVAWFTNQELFDVLLEKLNQDVPIDIELIIIDDLINNGDFGLNFQDFIDRGGRLYFSTSESPVHHKFCIIDNITTITGSYNWTYLAERKNHENIVICKQKSIAGNFNQEFERLKAIFPPVKRWKKINSLSEIYHDIYKPYYLEDRYIMSIDNPNRQLTDFISENFKNSPIEEIKNTLSRENSIILKSLGIKVRMNGEDGIFYEIIKKGENIPCEQSHTFGVNEKNIGEISVSVYAGNEKYVVDCSLLIEYKMKIKSGYSLKERMDVTFSINSNGILTVLVIDRCVPTNRLQFNHDITGLLE